MAGAILTQRRVTALTPLFTPPVSTPLNKIKHTARIKFHDDDYFFNLYNYTNPLNNKNVQQIIK